MVQPFVRSLIAKTGCSRVTKSREFLLRYGFAVFCTAIATYSRVQLSPYLGDRIPFGTYFLSVISVAWLAGVSPAIFALLLSVLAAGHFVIAPEGSWMVEDHCDRIALVIFFAVGSVSIALFYRLDSQRSIAQRHAEKNELLNRQLLESDKRKDDFLSLLAHELRCPLAPMGYAVDMLQRISDRPEQVKETSQVFARNLSHLVRLVDDLLDISRYTCGNLVLRCKTFDYLECIESAIEMIRPSVEAKQHELYIDVPASDVMVHGDPIRCCQILCNLLTNAVKYTPPQGRIQLTMKAGLDGISTVVEDNGIGISDSVQQQVFEPFYQVHSKRSRFSSGMGLGLAISKRLAELHEAKIELESDGLGRGCKFNFLLPASSVRVKETVLETGRVQSHASSVGIASFGKDLIEPSDNNGKSAVAGNRSVAPAETRSEPIVPTAPNSNAAKGRVMIVDDDCDTAKSLGFLLTLEGYQTKIAHDGMSALHECRNFRPQFVVLDIGLPGIDGYETARRFRSEVYGNEMTIVAVSGWGNAQDRQLGQQAGFDTHLVKPITVADLVPHLVGRTQSKIQPTPNLDQADVCQTN